MRKPVVDYRGLRLSNLTSPQYRHLLLLLGWVGYFLMYFLTENLIPADKCTPVWCPLDDIVPFNEWFVIPYVGWYVLIVVSLGYFLLYNVDNFKGLQTYIIVTQAIAVVCYIVWPSRQDLRPAEFPRENFLTWIMGIIYTADTNTGVCPSLHVAYSLGIASAWLKEKSAAWYVKTIVVIFVILVCLSVAFTKQHSVVDIFAALPVCLVAEIVAFGKYYKRKWKK
ncbi:MAG: phosphatidic acid phosphatase [Oscillospiraceae bacterium]|nr:phosphatidic acid phosphatase [Oscillospiraceae bacterium]